MARKKTQPYWLHGAEHCDLCEHPHAVEMLRNCAACDRAICGQCCQPGAEANEILCSACREDQLHEAGG
jgi:hypothetical protein